MEEDRNPLDNLLAYGIAKELVGPADLAQVLDFAATLVWKSWK